MATLTFKPSSVAGTVEQGAASATANWRFVEVVTPGVAAAVAWANSDGSTKTLFTTAAGVTTVIDSIVFLKTNATAHGMTDVVVKNDTDNVFLRGGVTPTETNSLSTTIVNGPIYIGASKVILIQGLTTPAASSTQRIDVSYHTIEI